MSSGVRQPILAIEAPAPKRTGDVASAEGFSAESEVLMRIHDLLCGSEGFTPFLVRDEVKKHKAVISRHEELRLCIVEFLQHWDGLFKNLRKKYRSTKDAAEGRSYLSQWRSTQLAFGRDSSILTQLLKEAMANQLARDRLKHIMPLHDVFYQALQAALTKVHDAISTTTVDGKQVKPFDRAKHEAMFTQTFVANRTTNLAALLEQSFLQLPADHSKVLTDASITRSVRYLWRCFDFLFKGIEQQLLIFTKRTLEVRTWEEIPKQLKDMLVLHYSVKNSLEIHVKKWIAYENNLDGKEQCWRSVDDYTDSLKGVRKKVVKAGKALDQIHHSLNEHRIVNIDDANDEFEDDLQDWNRAVKRAFE